MVREVNKIIISESGILIKVMRFGYQARAGEKYHSAPTTSAIDLPVSDAWLWNLDIEEAAVLQFWNV